ncbi:biotin-dependent carboxyltransferase family protein [Planosporangium mesophilum]|uniref:Allophanate hydrolase n=1 Tax=Planosporangium mesophilum TaxID=689768 RepID=A0A8J3TBM1_9ACTN|nr:biotin-dependent carboxyltransferase family protein [Planosporangium mesophilum]NJC82136.1 biotin-dependent carboxyltransferase family protein [Planosporangium mesophilum]GII22182.1 allophanate hydrolase [Planosporangium mesophilum]
MITVVRAGPLTTVQDLGRPGWAHLGVPVSGALDAPALRLANRLVGNPDGTAGLEITAGRYAMSVARAATVALTGADAGLTVAGRPAPFGAPVAVPNGATVEVGPARHGVRSYLAIAGGVDVPAVLGSRSTDTLSGLGPKRLCDGDELPLGEPTGEPSGVDFVPTSVPRGDLVLRVRLGPRDDWFTDPTELLTEAYTVDVNSNRVGARLTGRPLTRAVTDELPSEGIVLGAVQVPANGQPLVFLADHPTTGGYPVIGVVDEADLPLLAQARPGDRVRFRLS